MLALEAHSLSKSYPGALGQRPQEALRGVELAVPAGCAFGLIGPNGAGKTTFLKCLLAIARPSAGSVRLLGGDPADPEVRARVGYLPERLQLPPAWSALEVLASVARHKRLRGAGPACGRLLEELGLAAEARRRVGTFSKGMRQRVGLACALLGEPELLLLDEPTDGLDPVARLEVRNRLGRELARGATLFVNSHLMSETERLCTRVGVLVQGRIVREGALEELRRPTRRWTLRFDGAAAPDALARAGFTPSDPPGRWSFDGEPPALNAAIDRARGDGALLLELSREERALEELLAEAVGGAR